MKVFKISIQAILLLLLANAALPGLLNATLLCYATPPQNLYISQEAAPPQLEPAVNLFPLLAPSQLAKTPHRRSMFAS